MSSFMFVCVIVVVSFIVFCLFICLRFCSFVCSGAPACAEGPVGKAGKQDRPCTFQLSRVPRRCSVLPMSDQSSHGMLLPHIQN